jgi:hypothetical protein
MVPPLAGLGHTDASASSRYDWLTAERQPRVRAILLGLSLFLGLAVWVFHSLGVGASRDVVFVNKLRGVGVLTWIYALVQMIDLRFYRSRFARRRLASGMPQSVVGWLFGQMLAWFGILYYGLTQDARWYVAGMLLLVVSFLAFPVRDARE